MVKESPPHDQGGGHGETTLSDGQWSAALVTRDLDTISNSSEKPTSGRPLYARRVAEKSTFSRMLLLLQKISHVISSRSHRNSWVQL